jgi:hypothetical protein
MEGKERTNQHLFMLFKTLRTFLTDVLEMKKGANREAEGELEEDDQAFLFLGIRNV